MSKEKIIIFDTTLRDGEQSPGASLSVEEKVEIAHQLQRLNVDVIEAGFPVSSPAQFEAVKRIAEQLNVVVAGLSRANEKDIKAAADALKHANKPRIHTFSSTSDYHIYGKFGSDKYGKTLAEKRKTVLDMTYNAVIFAKTFTPDVEFSAEDAGRTDIGYLAEVVQSAIDAGATTINIPDTTGYTIPNEFAAKITELKRRVNFGNDVIISVHCHNDLGLAVANSLAAVESGARQVECTINGIGERAGNASLEEIVMALNVRKDLLNYYTGINTKEIYNTSRMVSSFTGLIVQRNKAIVGENAFSHESGIHQDGVLKSRETYEIMTPEAVGVPTNKIVLGRHSGKHGLKVRLEELGYVLDKESLEEVYKVFTELADKKKEVFDEDLRTIMGEQLNAESGELVLDYLQVSSGSNAIPIAVVRIREGEEYYEDSSTGDGPIAAVFNAINRALDIDINIDSYNVRSITAGKQAMGEVLVRIKVNNKYFNGRGVSTDIIEASAKAYLSALENKKKEKNYLSIKESVNIAI